MVFNNFNEQIQIITIPIEAIYFEYVFYNNFEYVYYDNEGVR
jgi:hypothetical protein